jgi:hypothetical protein
VLACLLLGGCGTAGLDRDPADEQARTCASLVERVQARALSRSELFGAEPPKEPIDPRVLADDPEEFYTELARRLDEIDFGPDEGPIAISPAARLVGRCQSVTR